ncbi:hypothetical protein PTKIN_Ptkin08bG0021000 [Pterospermum kingtungense]
MSNNNSGRSRRTRTRTIKAKSAGGVSVKYSRKTRTKTRKPKYLSLVHLGENLPQMSNEQEQLNLFPLHPENLVEDREDAQYDNVSLLFNTTEEDNVHAVSLNGLLDSENSDNHKNETTTTNTTVTSEESPLSPSLKYGHSGGGGGEDHTRLLLVRSAMKGKKERDESEEKWVVYSEVVEKKNNKEMEEVSSCCGGGDGGYEGGGGAWCSKKKKKKKLLALKLDYEEIMNAWSEKGPLYIEGESPRTVPDTANVLVDEWDSVFNVWKVPKMVSTRSFKVKEEFDGKEGWRIGHREASVLRYKEKRQNRLFSKRIRYEVRRLNAEKRPRLKGRFVKRD